MPSLTLTLTPFFSTPSLHILLLLSLYLSFPLFLFLLLPFFSPFNLLSLLQFSIFFIILTLLASPCLLTSLHLFKMVSLCWIYSTVDWLALWWISTNNPDSVPTTLLSSPSLCTITTTLFHVLENKASLDQYQKKKIFQGHCKIWKSIWNSFNTNFFQDWKKLNKKWLFLFYLFLFCTIPFFLW